MKNLRLYSEGWTFAPKDLWMGVRWERKSDSGKNPFAGNWLKFQVCPMLMFVYKFSVRW